MSIDFNICKRLSQWAVESLLYEVSATPKPGLVDRRNSGAHKDMDFFTFMSSASSLAHFYYQCAVKGMEFNSNDMGQLLDSLRPIGIEAEKSMFEATNGVNTHKGLIFSLGIICAAAANCYVRNDGTKPTSEMICENIIEMTRGISQRELANTQSKENMTYGEKLYKKYGVKGIRGEAESGYSTVLQTSLPVLREFLKSEKANMNDVLVQVLLHLMTVSEDTNVLARHDENALQYVKDCAKLALDLGGVFTEEGKAFIYKMDDEFILKNISPGGSADLLAVTIMFHFLERM